jgi:2-dehydro-3-deoxy-D-arabinonate dehydratase
MTVRGPRLVRLRQGGGRPRLGVITADAPNRVSLVEGDPLALLADGLADATGDETVELLDPETLALPEPWELLLPLDPPEVWAAGVTYERSRDARIEESRTDARDVYSLVYEAERPELFMKDAAGRRTVGPGRPVAVRSDADWSVPEPELGVVVGSRGKLLGVTVGNDVSSRDIEGANPLYLPQAKIYAAACALGPAVLVPGNWDEPFEIAVRISEDGRELFSGSTSTARMRRSFDELVGFLFRDNPVPAGSVLLTGTGLVPPDEVSLQPGQQVEIRIDGIGTLVNPVVQAGDVV